MNRASALMGVRGATLVVLLLQSVEPSLAVTFGQTEVPQDKFIAIAVPRASGYYNLLVLEQISDKKPCWRETDAKPTRVEPLLLNFNFTGVCGRGTDSNGYSLRVAGQDLGLTYHLSLQKSQKDLILMGIPNSSSQGKPIEVGRTNGIRSGFLKINLSPGWRFAKRNYSGKTLGHIYFSRKTAAPPDAVAGTAAVKPVAAKPPAVKPPAVKPPAVKPASVAIQPVGLSKSVKPPAVPTYKTMISSAKPSSRPIVSRPIVKSSTSYRVMVVAADEAVQAKVRSKVPNAFRTSYDGKTVMQVGLFSDRAKAESLKKNFSQQGFKVLIAQSSAIPIPVPKVSSSLGSGQPSGPIAVPSGNAPMGQAHGAKEVYGAKGDRSEPSSTLPPPPLMPQYRVLVMANNMSQQTKVRALVPSSFRTSYQGHSVLQVGAFRRPEETEAVIQLMRRHGFSPITAQI